MMAAMFADYYAVKWLTVVEHMKCQLGKCNWLSGIKHRSQDDDQSLT